MTDYNLKISSSQIDKLKEAFKTFDNKELDATSFVGNAESIFETINSEHDNMFNNTGLDDILKEISGDDGNISEEEIKAFMETDGDEIFSVKDFETYAIKALEESLNGIDTDNSVKSTEKTQEVKTKEYTKDDGSKVSKILNEDGTTKTKNTSCPDGTSIATDYVYDENGKKIGSVTKRFDENGNLQSTTEAKYDEQGRKIYGKTTDADGKLKGENNYKYQENDDGTTSQLRYNAKTNELKETVVYKESVKEPISKTNNTDNSVETFTKNSDGNMSSIIKSSSGNITEENSYDKNGNVLTSVKYNDNGEKISETTYKYYDNGELKNENTVTFEVKDTEAEKSEQVKKTEEVKEKEVVSGVSSDNTTIDSVSQSNATYSGNGTGKVSDSLKQALDNKLGQGFTSKVEDIAEKINCDPNDLLALMYSESGINPKAGAGSTGATGLIQFMPQTAEALGTTTSALANMSAIEQLDYVEKFFDKNIPSSLKGQKLDAGTLYSLVFLPGRSSREVLTTSNESYYQYNKGLDLDGDGNISKTDLQNRLAKKYNELNSAFA